MDVNAGGYFALPRGCRRSAELIFADLPSLHNFLSSSDFVLFRHEALRTLFDFRFPDIELVFDYKEFLCFFHAGVAAYGSTIIKRWQPVPNFPLKRKIFGYLLFGFWIAP